MIWILINLFFMCFSLNLAFNKKYRPMTWGSFYWHLFAAGINLLAVVLNTILLVVT